MRKVLLSVVLSLGVVVWSAAASRAQGAFGLGDALKKGATDAAKQKANQAVGVPGAADAAVNPKGAVKGAADSAASDANTRATGAARDTVSGALGGATKQVAPVGSTGEPR